MSKPKVLVCVLCGIERQNWINPQLSLALFKLARDTRFDLSYGMQMDMRPWETARNMTIHAARSMKVDWLISFDNDNFPFGNVLDIIKQAGPDQHVIGLRYGAGCLPRYMIVPALSNRPMNGQPFREVKEVGGGVLMIHRTVWEKIPTGPWFRWAHDSNELLYPGPGTFGEDYYFCHLVREHGMHVWTHEQELAGHYRTTDLTGLVFNLSQLTPRT